MPKSLEKVQKLKSELDLLRPLSKEDELRIFQKLRLDWNYHSNHIEGNTLTYGETKALILFGITAQGKPLRHHFEITGHNDAVNWIMDIVKENHPLTENFIRELHELILKEPYESDAVTPEGKPVKKKIQVGKYKKQPNHVRTKNGEIFRFATPEETPALMSDLIVWYKKEKENPNFNPLFTAAKFHYKFIRIHPFDDGNGRTARILMNFILLQYGYPPVIIRSEDKINYLAALRQADAGEITPFIYYIAQNLVRSLEIMIKGAKGESVEEPDDIDKEIMLLEQKLQSFSAPAAAQRNKQVILNIFDYSVKKLIEQFIEKGKLFEKFYLENTRFVRVDKKGQYFLENETLKYIRENINEDTYQIKVSLSYNKFNQQGFQRFDYYSFIQINFYQEKYEVFNLQKNLVFEKTYTEQLADDEISKLVQTEVYIHKQRIEKEIEKISSK